MALLAERLLLVLRREMGHLEKESLAHSPRRRRPLEGEAVAPGRSKERIEALGHMTRSLEKLMELARIERRDKAAEMAPEDDAAAVERLREEMMARLRSLDARRGGAPGLFGMASA